MEHLDPMHEKLECFLQICPEGGYLAFAETAPISVRGASLGELRRNLAAAVRAFFGKERQTALLVGYKPAGH